MGFEAISQYANNLFRKPWRKEFRCIKVNLVPNLIYFYILNMKRYIFYARFSFNRCIRDIINTK